MTIFIKKFAFAGFYLLIKQLEIHIKYLIVCNFQLYTSCDILLQINFDDYRNALYQEGFPNVRHLSKWDLMPKDRYVNLLILGAILFCGNFARVILKHKYAFFAYHFLINQVLCNKIMLRYQRTELFIQVQLFYIYSLF